MERKLLKMHFGLKGEDQRIEDPDGKELLLLVIFLVIVNELLLMIQYSSRRASISVRAEEPVPRSGPAGKNQDLEILLVEQIAQLYVRRGMLRNDDLS